MYKSHQGKCHWKKYYDVLASQAQRSVIQTTRQSSVEKSFPKCTSINCREEDLHVTYPDARGQHSGFLHHEIVEEGVEAVEGAIHSHRHLWPLHLVEYARHPWTQNSTLCISTIHACKYERAHQLSVLNGEHKYNLYPFLWRWSRSSVTNLFCLLITKVLSGHSVSRFMPSDWTVARSRTLCQRQLDGMGSEILQVNEPILIKLNCPLWYE